MELKRTDTPVKKKVSGALVSKGDVDNLLKHERTHENFSHIKGATTYDAFYCELLRQNSPYLLNVVLLSLKTPSVLFYVNLKTVKLWNEIFWNM